MAASLCGGCRYDSTVVLDEGDAEAASDGGPIDGPVDADVGASDGGPIDGPVDADVGAPDASSPDLRLAHALSCELSQPQALDAAIRHVACDRETRATVSGLFEAWQAGLFGSFERHIETTAGYVFQFGCEVWRCIAAAESCSDHAACLDGVREGGCASESRCEGSMLEHCLPKSFSGGEQGFAPVFDCSSVGASCEDGACTLGECEFGRYAEELRCAGADVSLCDGAVTIPCDVWREGTSCQSFAIGGEIPTHACMPEGFGGAGAYPFAVDCTDGVIAFDALGEEMVVDCLERGYSGCDDRGCVP